MVSFTTRPLYPRYPMYRRTSGSRSRSGRGGQDNKNSYLCRELNLGHPACSLVTVLTEILIGKTVSKLVLSTDNQMHIFLIVSRCKYRSIKSVRFVQDNEHTLRIRNVKKLANKSSQVQWASVVSFITLRRIKLLWTLSTATDTVAHSLTHTIRMNLTLHLSRFRYGYYSDSNKIITACSFFLQSYATRLQKTKLTKSYILDGASVSVRAKSNYKPQLLPLNNKKLSFSSSCNKCGLQIKSHL
jgi:hypothetical protein